MTTTLGPARLWTPCDLGCVDLDTCPDVPPAEFRCSEMIGGGPTCACNHPNCDGGWRPGRPCRVIGNHTTHRDGMGTSWLIEAHDGEA